jgi:DNA-binding NtrC family response regulator
LFNNKSIGIVEPNTKLLNILSEALNKYGYDVCSFTNLNLAYEHINDSPDKYYLILIDDNDDNMDALFFGTKFLEINPDLNVIILSNSIHLECNYKFKILKKQTSIYKFINVIHESIAKSISLDNTL